MTIFSVRSLNLSPSRSKCGRRIVATLTSSSHTSTRRSRLDEGRSLPAGEKDFQASGKDDCESACDMDLRGNDIGMTYLIWDDEHPHPSAQYPEGVDGIERLTTAVHLIYQQVYLGDLRYHTKTDLCECQTFTLCRSDRPYSQRNPIN